MTGASFRTIVHCVKPWLFALLASATAGPAVAISRQPPMTVPAGTLGAAIVQLGLATGTSIGLADPRLAALATRRLAGRLTPWQALQALTRGLPVMIVVIDASTFRLDPIAMRRTAIARQLPEDSRLASNRDIVVTASKRDTRLDRFPGAAYRIALRSSMGGADPSGSDAIVDALTSVGSTELGAGRNKLFLRGVADSSFNGLSQATVGQYLGEARLTYDAPDPDLLLIDVADVEVLEGPQGTLYGAGALGGVVRIEPNPVRLDKVEAAITGGLSSTTHGAASSDLSALINLPLLLDRVAVRLIGYRAVEGGYIDDSARGLADINRTVIRGGRIAVRGDLGAGWSIEGGATLQFINAADGQYAERGQPPLTRANAIEQPFDNDYHLGDLVVRGAIGGMRLLSATSIVAHNVGSTYDFTPSGNAARQFDQGNTIGLLSNETRVAETREDGTGWLVGISLLRESERLIRTLGAPPDPPRITGVRNLVLEGAAYGEWTTHLAGRLFATVGARATRDRLSGEQLDQQDHEERPGQHRHDARLVPLAALSWRLRNHLLLFARYAEGYRPGGLSVAGESDPGSGASPIERYRSDVIGTYELGARAGDPSNGRWSGTLSSSLALWRHVQADLVNAAGFPYTANIGDGRILSLDATASFRPTRALCVEAGLSFAHSDLTHADLVIADPEDRDLPNVPSIGARAALDWHRDVGHGLVLDVTALARFVGRSHLGAGDVLDIPQGDYVDSMLKARLGTPRLGFTVSASNLADERGNRFSLGDPFNVADRTQVTPLRPRTVRVGFDARL